MKATPKNTMSAITAGFNLEKPDLAPDIEKWYISALERSYKPRVQVADPDLDLDLVQKSFNVPSKHDDWIDVAE